MQPKRRHTQYAEGEAAWLGYWLHVKALETGSDYRGWRLGRHGERSATVI